MEMGSKRRHGKLGRRNQKQFTLKSRGECGRLAEFTYMDVEPSNSPRK